MNTKEELRKLVDSLSDDEAKRALELIERGRRNPLLDLQGLLSSGRTDGAEHHDTYVYGPPE